MKYNQKTAVKIMTENDRKRVIPFLESLGGVNTKPLWQINDIKIGDIWFIKEGKQNLYIVYKDSERLSDYTILEGVPKGWRERSLFENQKSLAPDMTKILDDMLLEKTSKPNLELDQLE